MSSTFCPLPWIFLSLRNNGEYRLCSHANQATGKGLLHSPGGVSRADMNAISDTRNAPLAKEARRKMLNGEWPDACVRCEKEEKAGLYSRRQIEGDVWRRWIDLQRARSLTSSSGEITAEDYPLRHFDIRFGNHCNLKCRSCSPTESSQWLNDHVELWGNSYDESTSSISIFKDDKGRHRVSPDLYQWHESDHFWLELQKVLPQLKSIYFAGGEPLLIRRHYELLEECVVKGYAKNLILEYNTNLTVLPGKVLELWSHFAEIKIGISVDGIGEANNYIRHPSKWETIEKNLQRIDNAPGNFSLWLAPTIMIYNVLEIPQMMIWKLSQNFKRINNNPDCLFFSAHPLHRPHFLNIQSLPSKAKEEIKHRLLKSKAWVLEEIHQKLQGNVLLQDRAIAQMHEIIDGYISFMFLNDMSQDHKKFWYFTESLDKLRKESFKDSLPELAGIFTNL